MVRAAGVFWYRVLKVPSKGCTGLGLNVQGFTFNGFRLVSLEISIFLICCMMKRSVHVCTFKSNVKDLDDLNDFPI